MVQGAKGCISVTANLLPNIKADIIHLSNAGKYDEARVLNNSLYPLNNALFCEANPIPIKAAMYIAGLIDTLEYRLPLTPPLSESMRLLEKTLEKYEVIK